VPNSAWLARVAPAIWVVLALVVIGLGALLLAPIGPTGWIFALLFLLYLYLVSVILTRA
jgi:hypothetical protein